MNKLFKMLELGLVEKISKIDSSQNKVFKVISDKGVFVVKELINMDDLFVKIKQINMSIYLNNNNIKTIVPLKFENDYFIKYNDKYYLIFNFFDYEIKDENNLELNDIKILAENLANIHNLNISSDLSCHYKLINIDINYYLEKFKNNLSFETLYNLLFENKKQLNNLIEKCNNSLNLVNKFLCVSHNDYKLKNILWNKNDMFLIDFDACYLSNPIVSLAECSFALSKQNNKINLIFYKEFLNTYFENFKGEKINYIDALNCAMNGKLQWLEFLLSESIQNKGERITESIEMINELLLFIKNKEEFINIYNSLT